MNHPTTLHTSLHTYLAPTCTGYKAVRTPTAGRMPWLQHLTYIYKLRLFRKRRSLSKKDPFDMFMPH
eukprot:366029-Chlamydomonas_euryale.AAC.31